jgi:dTDP-4-amino-4,6-dideoxygalactose transaminase
MGAHHAGLRIEWSNKEWEGVYHMTPSPIRDCAKRFTEGMFGIGQVQCVSFHARKLLKIGTGGAILHDDPIADEWYRRMRFDGRREGVATADDTYAEPGWHCYMLPEQAARGLQLLDFYPNDMSDQAMDPYPDMSRTSWKK